MARTWDRGFVPAGPSRVYRHLIDPASYAEWWPRVRPRASNSHLVIPGIGRATAELFGHRPGAGVWLRLSRPEFAGTLEWFLEPFRPGTVVHALLVVERARRWTARRELAYRASVRTGLLGLRRLHDPGLVSAP